MKEKKGGKQKQDLFLLVSQEKEANTWVKEKSIMWGFFIFLPT